MKLYNHPSALNAFTYSKLRHVFLCDLRKICLQQKERSGMGTAGNQASAQINLENLGVREGVLKVRKEGEA